MVVGTVDKMKKFHALCFALCVIETTEDFTFIFETLKNSVQKFTETELAPKVLISDASLAIRNAFTNVFPSVETLIMCYVHVLRNVDKRKNKYQKKNRNEIMRDIGILHNSSSADVFNMLKELFLKKWYKKDQAFAEYFKSTWLQSHCNWYLGAAEYTPSTNNSIEGEPILLVFET